MAKDILSNAQDSRFVHFFHTRKALRVMLLASGILRKGLFCLDGRSTHDITITDFLCNRSVQVLLWVGSIHSSG